MNPKPIRWVDVFGDGSFVFWPCVTTPAFDDRASVLGFRSGTDGDSPSPETSPLL